MPENVNGFVTKLTLIKTGVDRNEPVQPQHVLSAPVHEHAHFGRAGLDNIQGDVVGTVAPAAWPQTWPNEGFFEVPMIPVAVGACCHQCNVGDRALACLKPSWQCDINMRSAEVGMRATCVQMLARLVGLHIDRLSPIEKVFAGRSTNRSTTFVKPTKVTDVLLFGFRPKGSILRIKAAEVFCNDRFFLQESPIQSVLRGERFETTGTILVSQLPAFVVPFSSHPNLAADIGRRPTP